MIGYIALTGFMLTIPAANWLIGNVGTHCVPDGPCLIPIGFGMDSPSGVLMIGLAFVLRDVVQERLGWRWTLGAIFSGGLLSGLISPPQFVVASIVAFTLSELADMAVYTPLRQRRLWLAVAGSQVAGALVDSALFLWLALGHLDYVVGNTIGKFWMVLPALAALWAFRQASEKRTEDQEDPEEEICSTCAGSGIGMQGAESTCRVCGGSGVA